MGIITLDLNKRERTNMRIITNGTEKEVTCNKCNSNFLAKPEDVKFEVAKKGCKQVLPYCKCSICGNEINGASLGTILKDAVINRISKLSQNMLIVELAFGEINLAKTNNYSDADIISLGEEFQKMLKLSESDLKRTDGNGDSLYSKACERLEVLQLNAFGYVGE